MVGRALAAVQEFWRRKGPKSRLEKFIVYGVLVLFFVILPVYGTVLTAIVSADDREVTFSNQTGESVRVFVDGWYEIGIGPGKSRTEKIHDWNGPKLIEGLDRDGKVVFAVRLTRTEIDQLDRRVVIRSDASPSQ